MGSESLQGLKDLHRDLLALNESRLTNVERLALELETHIEAFRALLDKRPRSSASRQAVLSGSLKIDDNEFALNDDFKQTTFEIAEALDLDETEAASLLLDSQESMVQLDRSPITTSVILFHERRQFLLESLRITLQQANEDASDNDVLSDMLQNFVEAVVGQASQSSYWRKCVESFASLESWLHQVSDRIQSASIVGHARSSEFNEIMEFQRSSLTSQHQSLGAISYHLIRANRVRQADLPFLLSKVRVFERYDAVLVDYLPSLTGLIFHFAGSESRCSLEEAQALHQQICSSKENEGWRLRTLQALTTAFWVVEYNGRFVSQLVDSSLPTIDSEKESEECLTLFMDSLKDGAFHLMLSLGQLVQNSEWFDPVRHAFTTFLLQDGPQLQLDPSPFSAPLRSIMMEQFQIFAESYISNMPDSLRRLKFEEDEQRRQAQSRVQLRASEYDLHLERFLLLLAYAYEGDPQRAREFWIDPEGNLFGFLQWAAQKQSTPRIAAFCEMLRSISEGEECSSYAHKFLLEEPIASGKLRKNTPLSWTTIFSELEYYSSNLQDRNNQPTVATSLTARTPSMQVVEPESSMMLECYLRLISHLCSESSSARDFILYSSTFKLVHHLFKLCSSNIESRFRACAFTTFNGLLTNKDKVARDSMWEMLDAWIFNATNLFPTQGTRVQTFQLSLHAFRAPTFDSLAQGFEQPSSLVGLLTTLITPLEADSRLGDYIPFAENLGQAYRMPGIEPYVDFVLGNVFAQKSLELHDPIQLTVLRLSCLTFATTALSTFNETLFVLAGQSSFSIDEAVGTSSLDTYARLHPFGRVMEWFFNDKVISSLFAALDPDLEKINSTTPDSPLVLSVLRAVEAIHLIMSLQSTYFNVVRPRIKMHSATRQSVVANAALVSFEDVLIGKLDLLAKLGLFCVSGHQELAISALSLLHKISTSRRFTLSSAVAGTNKTEKSRLVTSLERGGASETISRAFVLIFEFDEREIEQGIAAPGFVIKSEMLRFLNACLAQMPNQPTIAHLLLGFKCQDQSVEVSPEGLFATGQSLFHAIVRLSAMCPDGNGTSVLSPLVTLVDDCVQVIRKLWKSPMTYTIVLSELQNLDFVFVQALRQPVLHLSTLWDGRSVQDPDFLLSDSALALGKFLQQRTAYLELLGTEVRESFLNGMASLLARLSEVMLGKVYLQYGETSPCASVLELLDFSNLDIYSGVLLPPESQHLTGMDFEVCKEQPSDPGSPYNLTKVHQLLALRERAIRKQNASMPETDIQTLQTDAMNIENYLTQINQRNALMVLFNTTLRHWTQLVISTLEHGHLDPAVRRTFTLQVLILMLPRFDRALNEDLDTAILLAQLGRYLMRHFQEPQAKRLGQASDEDTISDKLFQLFRTCIAGLPTAERSNALREICYQTALAYLRTIDAGKEHRSTRKSALQVFKQIGDHLFEILCDDACSAGGSCRELALLLLGNMVTIANSENAKNVNEQFTRLNFFEVIIDAIKGIPASLEGSSAQDVSRLLSHYAASLCLLLRVCQTRTGAAEVMNAGFLTAARESRLLSVDPDVGLDIDNPTALTRFFELVLDVVRIINAIVVSRGHQNEQTINQARFLLRENRSFVVAILKRNTKVRGTSDPNEQVLAALAANFTALISTTSFLEAPEEADGQKKPQSTFS